MIREREREKRDREINHAMHRVVKFTIKAFNVMDYKLFQKNYMVDQEHNVSSKFLANPMFIPVNAIMKRRRKIK